MHGVHGTPTAQANAESHGHSPKLDVLYRRSKRHKLIHGRHICPVGDSARYGNQKNWSAVCLLACGDQLLFRGTRISVEERQREGTPEQVP